MFVGDKGVCKTTLANYLKDEFLFEIYSLAGPLKNAVRDIFSLSREQTDGNLKEVVDERYGVTPRKLMQVVGTELFQYDIMEHIPELKEKIPPRKLWIHIFKQEYEKIKESCLEFMKLSLLNFSGVTATNLECQPNVVIDDVRFIHEAEEIKKMGGVVIELVRIDGPENDDTHSSEQEFKEIKADFYIHVDHTLEKEEALNDLSKILEVLKIFKIFN